MSDEQTLAPTATGAEETPPMAAASKSASQILDEIEATLDDAACGHAQILDEIEATLDDAACGHAQIRALLNVVRHLLPAEQKPPLQS